MEAGSSTLGLVWIGGDYHANKAATTKYTVRTAPVVKNDARSGKALINRDKSSYE